MLIHTNDGKCQKCLQIINLYPKFNQDLLGWFITMQAKFPEFHASCGGRGKIDQEAAFHRGASNAHWMQSAHNYNTAIDTFFLIDGEYNLDQARYDQVVAEMPNFVSWLGSPGSSFYERPHFEIAIWRVLAASGAAALVEKP